MRLARRRAGLTVVLCMAMTGALAGVSSAWMIQKVSVNDKGWSANNHSYLPSISGTGRFVAFQSEATNLVDNDTNGHQDVFVRDRELGTTTRASIPTGTTRQAGGESAGPSISPDGGYVAFWSEAGNLDSRVRKGGGFFLRDCQGKRTEAVSVDPPIAVGGYISYRGCSVSNLGRYVAFQVVQAPPGTTQQILLRDRTTNTTHLVSRTLAGKPGNGDSTHPSVSNDGLVAFTSRATDLTAGDPSNVSDIYIYDHRTKAVIQRIARDRTASVPVALSYPSISPNGRYVTFCAMEGGAGVYRQVLILDRSTGRTQQASVSSSGKPADADCQTPSVAELGTNIVFCSVAGNLGGHGAPGTCQVFLRSRANSRTTLLSLSKQGVPGNGYSGHSVISADGRYVAFDSGATNLVPHDTKLWDVFVAETNAPPSVFQPDMMVRWPWQSAWTGQDVYGSSEQQELPVHKVGKLGGTVDVAFRVQNDSDLTQNISIHSYRKVGYGWGGWPVRFWSAWSGPRTEVTGQVTSAQGWIVTLGPGKSLTFRGEVRVLSGTSEMQARRFEVEAKTAGMVTPLPDTVAARIQRASQQGSAGGMVVSRLAASSGPAGVTVTFVLPQAATVEARVMNLAGRLVRTITRSAVTPAGEGTLLWDARSDTGVAAPAGTYLVEVTAHTADGQQARALTQVRLVR